MGHERAIESGKEKRKRYRGPKSVSQICRNNGSCPYCKDNRIHKNHKRLQRIVYIQSEFYKN